MKDTNLQRYLNEALWRSGRTGTWRDYLRELRTRPMSYLQITCEIYKDTGITVDGSTLARWLHQLDLREPLETPHDASA